MSVSVIEFYVHSTEYQILVKNLINLLVRRRKGNVYERNEKSFIIVRSPFQTKSVSGPKKA